MTLRCPRPAPRPPPAPLRLCSGLCQRASVWGRPRSSSRPAPTAPRTGTRLAPSGPGAPSRSASAGQGARSVNGRCSSRVSACPSGSTSASRRSCSSNHTVSGRTSVRAGARASVSLSDAAPVPRSKRQPAPEACGRLREKDAQRRGCGSRAGRCCTRSAGAVPCHAHQPLTQHTQQTQRQRLALHGLRFAPAAEAVAAQCSPRQGSTDPAGG